MRPAIICEGVTVALGRRVILENLTMEVAQGEFAGIIGPNGAGKTTLLRAILGLVPLSGRLTIFDCNHKDLRCSHRAQMGYVPQKERVDPNFPITVWEVAAMGRFSSIGLLRRPALLDRKIVSEALEAVGMLERETAPFGSLSGGQQQRVLSARALAQQPRVLLLDEPTTGVDAPTQHSILELIRRLHRERGLLVLFVTHDINLISPFADSLILLNRRLYAKGPREGVLRKEILQEVYGKEVIVTSDAGRFVIISDHHRG